MKITMGQRRSGKTTAILLDMSRLSTKELATAVCFTMSGSAARAMYQDAKTRFPNRPWTQANFQTITNWDAHRRGRRKIYIDELDGCLRQMFAGNELVMVTVDNTPSS